MDTESIRMALRMYAMGRVGSPVQEELVEALAAAFAAKPAAALAAEPEPAPEPEKRKPGRPPKAD